MDTFGDLPRFPLSNWCSHPTGVADGSHLTRLLKITISWKPPYCEMLGRLGPPHLPGSVLHLTPDTRAHKAVSLFKVRQLCGTTHSPEHCAITLPTSLPSFFLALSCIPPSF